MKKYTSQKIKEFVSKPYFNEKTILNKDPNYPKVSIVTPSYNQAKFLERTILSVLNQNYPNLEYIIIDGGSTDGSVEIIKKYEKYLAYWVSEPDKGQSEAINKGFQRTTGEWFCWVNSDDVLFAYALEMVLGVIKKDFKADIITGNVVFIDENDFIIKCRRVPKQSWFFYKHSVGYFNAPAIFFKKELYEKVGKLDINLHYSMDVDLWHKYRLAGAKVYHIAKYLGGFRVHGASKTGPRIMGIEKLFENPETTLIRSQYIPKVSKTTIRLFRLMYKIYQIINFNYIRKSIDFYRWKGKKWQEIFQSKNTKV